MQSAIRVTNLGKRYQLGVTHSGSLGELANRLWGRIRGRKPHVGRQIHTNVTQYDGDYYWALRDVSFEVRAGEVVGIIGKNGAGKSTLLKLLSKITLPNTGRIEIRGRVASLLEVGTGFHLELTGRENCFLNGAILGMSKAEIRSKFDEIVAFAEISKFIDTPVKRYSSGMYVRLAFAVAAHLDPEILIVDEVLAVGDAAFQTKCLSKMGDVARQGRTVLFVSHNVSAVRRLCERCVILKSGRVALDGPVEKTLVEYLESEANCSGELSWPDGVAAPGVSEFSLKQVRILDCNGAATADLAFGDPLSVEFRFRIKESLRESRIGFTVSTIDGTAVFQCFDVDAIPKLAARTPGEYRAVCTIPQSHLLPGRYLITVVADIPGIRNLALLDGVLSFEIHEPKYLGPTTHVAKVGVIQPDADWVSTIA